MNNQWHETAWSLTEILREDLDDPGRMAVPALHFRSAHPNGLALYRNDDEGYRPAVRSTIAALRDVLLGPSPRQGDDLPASLDVLFISHLLNRKQEGRAKPDHYYGDMPEQLAARGHAVGKVLIDQTTAKDPLAWSDAVIPRLVLRRRLERRAEIAIARALRGTARSIVRGSGDKDLRSISARNARQGSARMALRIAEQVAAIVAQTRPHTVIFTYEGHSWERSVIGAVRDRAPGTRCIAVHHAILAPVQHAMVQDLGQHWNPDHILAAGQIAYEWLRSEPGLAGIPVDLLGSPRATIPAEAHLSGDRQECLFLPEGLQSETTALARAALHLAREKADLTCRLRLHPLINTDQLEAMMPELRDQPQNLKISSPDRSLDQDCQSAKCAIYRGSSAILSAMAFGARPIYFGSEPADLRIDPLRGADGLVCISKDNEALEQAVMMPEPNNREIEALQNFCARYYTPLDIDVIESALGARPDNDRQE